MSLGLMGRVVAGIGIVTGLLAIGLDFSSGYHYSDDGTIAAFLLILLSFASYLPAEIGRDSFGAAAGAAAFGFFLFLPAAAGFDRFGYLGPGAWLGLCSVLIPIGLAISRAGEHEGASSPKAAWSPGLGSVATLAGLVLVVVGIWLDAGDGGPTYWSLSASGHALGILMLVLVALTALAVLASPTSDTALVLAATTFGLVEAQLVANAFREFGLMGIGAWIEACAGVVLLLGVVASRAAARKPAAAHVAAPSVAAAQ
jgi:hypothetical protein